MQIVMDYKYLNLISYPNLNSWDVKSYLNLKNSFNKKFPLVLFGHFLKKPIIDRIQIEDNKTYNILGVRSYGKGVFSNRIVKGNTLKMREYYKAKPNHLFWCKVDTKNGAFGVIKENQDGCIFTSNMTMLEIDNKKVIPYFIEILFRNKKVQEYFDNYISGSTNRKYVKINELLDFYIPNYSMKQQTEIVKNVIKAEQEIIERNNLIDENIELTNTKSTNA